MTTTGAKFARAFSLRDKSRTGKKTRVSDNNLFALDDNAKRASREEAQKIQEISLHFSRLGNNNIPEHRIEYALRSKAANGDVKEAIRLVLLYEDSAAGVLRSYDPNVKMLGAENRERQSCWLDSLLFAMFAKTDVFEAVLHQQYENEEKQRLVVALRLWVNLLRAGKLITVDLTTRIQNAIAECGWSDAAKLRQQDVSEAFNFITDTLQLPLLTLKTDIFHSGKEDANDDHKFITERMLDVAIPDNTPNGEALKLESCMEDYFNNRVEVKRHLARQNTAGSTFADDSLDKEKSGASHVETVEVRDSLLEGQLSGPDEISKVTTSSSQQQRPYLRGRAASVFSDRKPAELMNKDGEGSDDKEKETGTRKEVLMGAWQFLNLIPWYTDNIPEGQSQIRSHFSRKRLMLGICLKRYGMTANGTPYRRSTHIDIPLEMSSPHFAEEDVQGSDENPQNFKLVLKSFVCHRGNSVEAGHYISFVRTEAPRSDHHQSFSDSSSEQSPDASHDAWLKFDDLAVQRVTTVDISKVLDEESPYLLFYRVQPIDEHEPPDETPPPYQESDKSLDYVDQKLSALDPENRTSLEQPSARPSIEVSSPAETRGRPSLSERFDSQQGTTDAASSQAVSSQAASPTISRSATKSIREEPTRPTSDDSSRRFSMSMSKLAARLSRDKLNLPDIVVNEVITDDAPVAIVYDSPPADHLTTLKQKDKKKKFNRLNKSRRGSGTNNPGKPERDCTIM